MILRWVQVVGFAGDEFFTEFALLSSKQRGKHEWEIRYLVIWFFCESQKKRWNTKSLDRQPEGSPGRIRSFQSEHPSGCPRQPVSFPDRVGQDTNLDRGHSHDKWRSCSRVLPFVPDSTCLLTPSSSLLHWGGPTWSKAKRKEEMLCLS